MNWAILITPCKMKKEYVFVSLTFMYNQAGANCEPLWKNG